MGAVRGYVRRPPDHRLVYLVGVLPGTLAVRLPIIAGLTLMAGNACLGSLSPRA